ncbi:MAG TPA: hypothetical protein VG501_02425 [Rhizomicrobium sp.]|nr:hypothetical protein [Rhizomicrobium sp.]
MRLLTLIALLPLLAGCSSGTWDYLTHFGNDSEQATPEPAPRAATEARPTQTASAAPAGAQPGQAQPPDPFCLAIAREDATASGFDSATESRVAVRSYQQCIQIFGPNAGK